MEVELVKGEKICDLKYAHGVVCLNGNVESAQYTLDKISRALTPFGICIATSKCNVMYQDWDSSKHLLTLNVDSEVIAPISKVRGGCPNFLPLW